MNAINAITLNQIGNKALAMMGAKAILSDDDNNTINITLTGRRVNKILVAYNESTDLYDVEFGSVKNAEYKIIKFVEGVYNDDLIKVLESNTGLNLSIA